MGDPAASTLARLKNRSKELNIQFQQILILFSQEELVRRISLSKYRDNFILKGGYLLYSLSKQSFRPTVDSDYLITKLPIKKSKIDVVINNIIKQNTQYNYVNYEIKDYEDITVQMKYDGLRVKLISKIKNTRTHINIDFAKAIDNLIPKPKMRNLQTILNDFENPNILTYSLESVISEKLDSILYRMETNSRMKDFYDIYFLLKNFKFSGNQIKKAIEYTMNNRNRNYPEDAIESLEKLNNNSLMKTRWEIFCNSILNKSLDFEIIIKKIVSFLKPPYHAYYSNSSMDLFWNPKEQSYS